MQEIIDICDRIEWLGKHPYAIINAIFKDRELQKKILDLIRWQQLYEKGVDGKGRRLDTGGGYSPYTIFLKERKGQPTDRITLRDTGKFYDSFEFIISNNIDNDHFLVEVDPMKDDGKNLLVEWGIDIIGLSDESKEEIIKWVNEVFVKMVEEYIFKGGGTVIRSLAA